jgi:outer membrane putative beta-barrel porin/alpha-amylase
VKLSVNLSGAPPMAPSEFARRQRAPIIGASLTVVMPMGQYDPTKLVNLGSNRWSFKPEVGLSFPARRWTFDAYAGLWWFTDNEAYYPGSSHRRQDPVVAVQGHVSYTLGRRAWVAANATWYGGGQMHVDGVPLADPFRNARLGATWAIPVGTRQSLKVSYSDGAATRVGADFKTISGAWQVFF